MHPLNRKTGIYLAGPILLLSLGGCSDPDIPAWEEVTIRSARPWTLADGSTLKAKTVAENDYVVLVECGRLYSGFNGHILLRVAQLHDDDRQFLRKLSRTRVPDTIKQFGPTEGVLPGDDSTRSDDDREAMISLSQISLALRSFQIAHQGDSPPRAIFAADGTPLLSWRVVILPYLGELKLYEEFHLDEPWDSEHNRRLIDRIPRTYAVGTPRAAQGHTRFLAPSGKDTFWETEGGLTTKQIADGIEMTICAVRVRADRSVIWTKPDDLSLDLEAPSFSLDWADAEGFHAAFGDGRTAFLVRTMGHKRIIAYFTRDRFEVVPLLGDSQPRIPIRPG